MPSIRVKTADMPGTAALKRDGKTGLCTLFLREGLLTHEQLLDVDYVLSRLPVAWEHLRTSPVLADEVAWDRENMALSRS